VTTTYRQGCGTHMGMLLHQAGGEEPCGECRRGELLRRLEVEACPRRVPPPPALVPVTPEKAAEHRAVLLAALGREKGRDHAA
jgi:hypothetical protein